MSEKKLAIISTHPIQYNSPLFRMLSQQSGFQTKVFYTWEKGASLLDKEFGREVIWDIPLLEGFQYQFISNKGSLRKDFFGVKNPTLEQEILDWQATHVLIYGWNYLSHLRTMLRLKGKVKILFRGDSTLLDESKGLKKIIRRIFLTLVYRMVDYCIYVGNSNKSYFLTHGVKPDQLIFGPHAIDNCRFEHALNNSRNIRKQFEIKDHEILMLFAGKFIPKKNPIQLLDFFLKFQPKNAHLLFVGNGILEEKLKEKSLNNNRIHFLEFQNQSTMPSIYKEADVFILPSTGPGETWGLAINEAMVCGLPVLVSSKCGCSYDLVQDGENGFVFNQQNMELIIEKFLVKSRDEMKKMGEINPEIIKNYTYTKTIENLNKLINK